MLDPAPAGKILVETLASALGAHVLRNHSNLESASVSLPVARGALDPRRLQRVKDLIETHPGADLTIESAGERGVSEPFSFRSRLQDGNRDSAPSVRHGPPDRKSEVLDFWKDDARSPKSPTCAGSASQASFTKWFKRLVGVTPGAYRQGCR